MRISVIIPTYKRLAYLQSAVESVLAQTYRDFEVIIVNDNPADKEVINKLFGKIDGLTIIHHPLPKGGNAARNAGIRASTGDIIAFLDDDDIWLPEKLAVHAETHQNAPKAGLVFSDCLYTYTATKKKSHSTSYQLTGDVVDLMRTGRFCPATSSMVTLRMECVETCGLFDEDLVSFQDWDYWFRIAHKYAFAYIPTVLVHFRQHLEDRTSQNEQKRIKGINQICDKWQNEIDTARFSRTFIGNMYYKTAFNLFLDGKKSAAWKKGLRLFRREAFGVQSCKSFLSLSLRMLR